MAMEDLNKILDDFDEAKVINRGRVYEATFNEVFKPVFEGRIGNNTRLIEKWVELAGDPYAPVDLIGDDGEVVATVSGILVPLNEEARENYKDILGRFEEATSVLRINPIRAKALEDNAVEQLEEQGLIPSNAKSREYIKYHNKEVIEDDNNMYDL